MQVLFWRIIPLIFAFAVLTGCATEQRCARKFGQQIETELREMNIERKIEFRIPERTQTWTFADLPCDTVYEKIIDAGPTQPRVIIRREQLHGPIRLTAECPPIDTFVVYRPVEVVRTVTKQHCPNWAKWIGFGAGAILGLAALLALARILK